MHWYWQCRNLNIINKQRKINELKIEKILETNYSSIVNYRINLGKKLC